MANDEHQILIALSEMREANTTEHKAITGKLEAHSVQLACLETKWDTFWKLIKFGAPGALAIAGAVFAVMKLVS